MADLRPLCFVLMPFGIKKDPASSMSIDFDAIYEKGIKPAVEGAGFHAIRADEELVGGVIQKPMFERLLLCDYAIADLTTANANVYYELGIRHATRPFTTVSIFAEGQRPLFDINFLRCLPYKLGTCGNFGNAEATDLNDKLRKRLVELHEMNAENPAVDSPLFQLLGEYRPPDIARLKTDVFRDLVTYSAKQKQLLALARENSDEQSVAKLEADLGDFENVEAGVIVDLYLTWRALSKWDRMILLYDRLPAPLRNTIMVREQYGFALNRAGHRTEALRVLQSVLKDQGPSSETMSLIGRIYKDLWTEAQKAGDSLLANGYLDKAIAAYLSGFESDCRDAFPGINAATLLDIKGDSVSLSRKDELLPVIEFAVKQRLKSVNSDYWDRATLVELAVLRNAETEAMNRVSDALTTAKESWEPTSTANNLKLIRDARKARNSYQPWVDQIITHLEGETIYHAKS